VGTGAGPFKAKLFNSVSLNLLFIVDPEVADAEKQKKDVTCVTPNPYLLLLLVNAPPIHANISTGTNIRSNAHVVSIFCHIPFYTGRLLSHILPILPF